MPPEQVEGKELGPPTDIFAVAVLLMEAWSGVAPFRRATPELCNDAMREKHPRPSDYDPRLIPLDDVIVRAMQLDPKKRQQDAADVARALRAFLQGTDVTDIARELGDRVRDLREAASEPMPMSLDGKTRAPNPSVGDLGTKTFAAREEAVRWSSPPASEIEPPGASTRRLQESIPAPSELPSIGATPVAASTSSSDEGARAEGRGDATVKKRAPARPDPAMSIPTPLMVEPVGLGGDVVLRNARAAQDAALASQASERPRPAERVDTLATRPLETAVRGKNEARPGTTSSRSRVVSLVILAAVVVIGGGIAWRARSANERTDSGPAPTTSTAIASTASVTATTSSATVPPSTTKPAISASPPASAALVVNPGSVATSHPAPPSSASVAEKPGRTMVAFLGDPGTRVSIDGIMRGACPVRVSLEAGQHDVRFTFEPTGESRGERISVKPGEKIIVRAEFTGATPTVRIQR